MEFIKKKRIRKKEGQIFRVPLSGGSFGYGQVMPVSGSVFFDYTDDGTNTDPNFVIRQPILFDIGVDDYVIKDQIWEVIAILPVNPEFMEINRKAFTYSRDTNSYFIWPGNAPKFEVTPEDIKGIEMIASWDHRSVEQRLLDYFENRPNYTYESMHNRHDPNFPKTRKEFYAQYGYTVKEDEPDFKPE